MKTKITLGDSVRWSLYKSVYDSVSGSVWSSSEESVRESINNLIIWDIEL